ncbi:ABC transporter ATP-binding protein, partial [Pasteurella multocida]
YGLQQKKIEKAEQISRLNTALKQMDLEIHKLKMPNQLSGGQQQRVALARAMVTRPDVILFDEPLSNLDAKLRESVRFEIKQLSHQHNLTSIYVTHDQAEALAMSDKIIVLNKGSIEQIGTPQQIYHQPINRFVADFIGVANITEADVEPLGENRYKVRSIFGEFFAHSESPPAAKKIYICFRPEDAELCDGNSTSDNQFTVQVQQTAFMGNLTEIQATLPQQPDYKIRLQLTKFPHLPENGQLTFRLPNTAIHFLEAV